MVGEILLKSIWVHLTFQIEGHYILSWIMTKLKNAWENVCREWPRWSIDIVNLTATKKVEEIKISKEKEEDFGGVTISGQAWQKQVYF